MNNEKDIIVNNEKERVAKLAQNIKNLELKAKMNEEFTLKEVNDIKNELNAISKREISVSLGSTIYNLRAKLTKLKKVVYNRENPKLTKWDIFMKDVSELKGFDDLKTLVLLVEEKREENISQEELDEMEGIYSECLMDIHTKMTPYDRDIIVKEINKKMRLFNNRINRVVETGFGEWIKELRTEKGYSLKELESISTVTASYIHRLERGEKKTPSVPVIEKLAIALGVDPKECFSKLNIIEKKEPVDIIDLLKNEDILIHGKKISKSQRKNVVEMMNVIMNNSINSPNLLSAIDKFKQSVQKVSVELNENNEEGISVTAN